MSSSNWLYYGLFAEHLTNLKTITYTLYLTLPLTYAQSLTIGDITIAQVPVYVSPDYDGIPLLGMSVISQFATITIKDDRLYLEPMHH
jgi:hypothetical protein